MEVPSCSCGHCGCSVTPWGYLLCFRGPQSRRVLCPDWGFVGSASPLHADRSLCCLRAPCAYDCPASALQVTPVPELFLTAVKLSHEGTGAQYLHLAREDSNNLFRWVCPRAAAHQRAP